MVILVILLQLLTLDYSADYVHPPKGSFSLEEAMKHPSLPPKTNSYSRFFYEDMSNSFFNSDNDLSGFFN